MKTLTWPQAIVAASVLLVIGALAYAGKDTSALVTSGLAILGALGLLVKQQTEVKAESVAKLDAVQQQTNGNTKELMAIIKSQQEQIAALVTAAQTLQTQQAAAHRADLVAMANKLAEMQPATVVAAAPLPALEGQPV